MDDAAIQENARHAYLEFASRATVLLWFAEDLAEGFASGLVLRTMAGRPFLLTARHMLDEHGGWKPLRIMVPAFGGSNLCDAGAAAHFGPSRPREDVDVAVITLRPAAQSVLAPIALDLDVLGHDVTSSDGDVLLLTGFPAGLAFQSHQDQREWMFTRMRLVTGVKGTDPLGRLEVEWSGAPFPGSQLHPKLGTQPGHESKLVSPVGISGGELWRVAGATQGRLWAPNTHVKLIGVPVEWDKNNTELVEPVSLWGEWLREVAGQIDAGS